jgi:AraC family transcriptional regulator, regulatory protein of adaptative response / methylated-DNA-[protein]-cysteine methyltransferase
MTDVVSNSPRKAATGAVMRETVRTLVREIEADPSRPLRLSDLARRAGYSASHLQRNFAAITGSSPKAFQTAARMRLLKRGLRSPASVTDAIAAAGFGSTSRVYEKTDGELGMTPSEYKSGGAGLTIAYATGGTPLGLVMIGATDRGICALHLGRSDRALLSALKGEYPAAILQPMPASHAREFARWMTALNAHLQGARTDPELPLDISGTAFQLRVWRYLRGIPYGSVRTYAEVAAGIGRPSAARAVARACATNRIAVLIPCHRVVRGTGEISGYRWGVKRKRALLDGERATGRPSAAGG